MKQLQFKKYVAFFIALLEYAFLMFSTDLALTGQI